jgi:hypothetical protein
MAYPQGQTTRVRISYEQQLQDPGVTNPIVHATYVLRTGALWANQIGDARVTFTTSSGGGFVGGEQAVEQSDDRIAWHYVDFKPDFDLDTAYVLAAPWRELQSAEIALADAMPQPADYLRATKAALAVLGTDGPYGLPTALVSHYAPAMRSWAAQAIALDTAEAWEAMGDSEHYWAMPVTKNHGELACWPDAAASAYERAAELGSPSAQGKRTDLDRTLAFMRQNGMTEPPPCI